MSFHQIIGLKAFMVYDGKWEMKCLKEYIYTHEDFRYLWLSLYKEAKHRNINLKHSNLKHNLILSILFRNKTNARKFRIIFLILIWWNK
jgi:hypothetical protein